MHFRVYGTFLVSESKSHFSDSVLAHTRACTHVFVFVF